MDDEARDQANAALALDAQIAERIEETVLRMVEDTGAFTRSRPTMTHTLWCNQTFHDALLQLIRGEVHRIIERDLPHYLTRIEQSKFY